ncbi:MAG: type II toxin-antitoxin system PemK/MazF family toxin [Acidimicrobiales bacterium]
MRRGEMWWGEHPEAGRRPYLILSRDASIPVRQRVVVAPATRTMRNIPSEVAVDEDDGLPSPCAISLDNITTVPRYQLTERICVLSPERLHDVCAALMTAVDCR